MNYALEQFIDEAIQLELNAAEIYSIFSEAIPEDANFWATLAWEEKNHASVLRTGKDILMPMDQFPGKILPNVIQSLVDTNSWLDSLKEKFAEVKPDRETAFTIAAVNHIKQVFIPKSFSIKRKGDITADTQSVAVLPALRLPISRVDRNPASGDHPLQSVRGC